MSISSSLYKKKPASRKNQAITIIIFAFSLLISSCMTTGHLQVINSNEAPKVIGPYSHAIKVGHIIYCSGQIGINPASGGLIGNDIASQTKQALHNLQSVLAAAGS